MKIKAIVAKLAVLLAAISVSVATVYAARIPPPVPNENDSFVVVAVGDIACSPKDPNYNNGLGKNGLCQHAAVVRAINREPRVDAAVLLGDIQYLFGQYDDYIKGFQTSWQNIKAEHILAVTGNHDYGLGNARNFEEALPETFGMRFVNFKDKTYGSWEYKNWLFIGLDSDCQLLGGCGKNDPQGKWLKQTLAEHHNACSLAFWHYPIYSSGLYYGYNTTDYWAMFEKSGGDLVLNGHEHFYERFAPQSLIGGDSKGMPEFIVGTGGYSLFGFTLPYAKNHEAGFRQYGYLKLILHPSSYSWQFINANGVVLDSGASTSCNNSIPTSTKEDSSINHVPCCKPYQVQVESVDEK